MAVELPKVAEAAHGIVHPVAEIEKKAFLSEEQAELEQASRMFGLHMAVRLGFERDALSSFRRPAGSGLRSGLIGLEAALGRDEFVDFSDIHVDTSVDAKHFTQPSFHLGMQQRLGL